MKFRRIISAVSAAALMLSLCSCEKKAEADIFSMDTVMTLKVYGNNADTAIKLAEDKIKELDRLLSVTDESSDIGKINSEAGAVSVSADTEKLILRAKSISDLTGGAFDITLRPVSKLWGFTDKTPRVPSDDEIRVALEKRGSSRIEAADGKVSFDGEIDVGGIAKGYAASLIRSIFAENGIDHAVVSLGGNVMLYGERPDGAPWNVGIAHPEKEGDIIGSLTAADTAVVTSGGYERFFTQDGESYHHIIDPDTGYPAQSGIISATVISKDDALADALSTALYVMGPEKAERLWRETNEFDMILITEKEIIITDGIFDSFELRDKSFQVTKIEK